MSARTEARTAGSPGEVGNWLLVPWSLIGGWVPEEVSGRECILILPQIRASLWDFGLTWVSLVDEPVGQMSSYLRIL